MADILAPAADAFVCVTPQSERALPASELAACFEKTGRSVAVCDTVREGVTRAIDWAGTDGMVCAVGSLYMAGEIRGCFGWEVRHADNGN